MALVYLVLQSNLAVTAAFRERKLMTSMAGQMGDLQVNGYSVRILLLYHDLWPTLSRMSSVLPQMQYFPT